LDERSGTGTETRDHFLCISGTGGDLRTQSRLTDSPPAGRVSTGPARPRASSVPATSTMADFADDAATLLDGLAPPAHSGFLAGATPGARLALIDGDTSSCYRTPR
jgi:hypothetical protein